jgi:creatinine amidohydrolase/Fe(II)-dependent formamide hydrolase-like protein
MLIAIDADPRNCGYTKQQIADCLQSLTTEGIHQEGPGVKHLKYLLNKKKLITLPEAQQKALKPHPEILHLRFSPERSPINGVPIDLRRPLYRILLEHADGALRRSRRKWLSFNPLIDSDVILQPYPFELASEKTQKMTIRETVTTANSHLWAELTWHEAEQRLKEVDIALLPVGAIEQHGPHLTLDVDAFDSEYLAKRVAAACSDPKPLVLPVISYGVSYHHDEFKGTISISNNTLSRLVYDIGMSAAKNGINKLIIINGHGGNSAALNYAAQMINRKARIFVCVDTGETSDFDISEFIDTPNDVHAGEIETSTSLAVRPHLVRMDKAKKFVPEFSSRYLNFTSKRGVSWYAHTEKISPTGVMGDPTKASAKKGKKIWEIMIAHLVAFVEDLKSMTLDEIYQRRY